MLSVLFITSHSHHRKNISELLHLSVIAICKIWEKRYCLEYFISTESYVCKSINERLVNFCSKFNLVLAIYWTPKSNIRYVCSKNYHIYLKLYEVFFRKIA